MKKLILPILLLVACGMLLAVESDPSDIVGYFKRTATLNVPDAFALPFDYSGLVDMTPDAILGTQSFGDGDVLIDDTDASFATYYGAWYGIDNMYYGHGYALTPTVAGYDWYQLGNVHMTPYSHTVAVTGADGGGFSGFGLNIAAIYPLDDLAITGVEDGDIIFDNTNAQAFTYYGAWYGDVTSDYQPTAGCTYFSNAATGYTWTFAYTPVITPTPSPRGTAPIINTKSK